MNFYSLPTYHRDARRLREVPNLSMNFYSLPTYHRDARRLREVPMRLNLAAFS